MNEELQVASEELAALLAALAAAEVRAQTAEANLAHQTARAAVAEAKNADDAALIAHLRPCAC